MTDACRLCGGTDLETVLDLGEQALTGRFPKPGETVPTSPLTLVWCHDCTLLQLGESPDLAEMYGDNYGYRSGLNRMMVKHLRDKAQWLDHLVRLAPGDVVLDIGSNDGTFLASYPTRQLQRVGIDPTAEKFWPYYEDGITVVPDFFTADRFRDVADGPARIVTSIACFYDLEDPVGFAQDVHDCLAPDGVWHFEQSYLPAMLKATSYDMVCHEHLEYYSLTTVKRILDEARFVIVDVELNRVNGGSFAVTAARADSHPGCAGPWVGDMFDRERVLALDTSAPYRRFERQVVEHRDELRQHINAIRADGKTVMGYGASTKGNVILQYCGLGPDAIEAIAEVNEDKFGCVTPGTSIPIISEAEMRERRPDYLLVLPWHFRDGIIEREAEYLRDGGRLMFPLPEIEIVLDPCARAR